MPLLARIPLDPVLREAADAGVPVVEVGPECEAARAIVALAESVAASRAGTIRKPLTVLSSDTALDSRTCLGPRSSISTERCSRARARCRSPGRSARRGLIGRRQLVKAGVAQLVFMRFGADEPTVRRTAERGMSILRGLRVDELREIVAEAWEPVLRPLVYREALDLAASHAAAR